MSSIILKLTPLVLIIFFVFTFLPTTTLAVNCDFSYNPTPNQNMNNLTITFNSNDLNPGDYLVILTTPKGLQLTNDAARYKFNTGIPLSVTFNGVAPWPVGTYNLAVQEDTHGVRPGPENTKCKTTFAISNTAAQACTIVIENAVIYPDTRVTMLVENLASTGNIFGETGYDVAVNNQIQPYSYYPSKGKRIDLGTWPKADNYTVELRESCGMVPWGCAARIVCNPGKFDVISKPAPGAPPPPQVNTPKCAISPDMISDFSDVFFSAINLAPSAKFFIKTETRDATAIYNEVSENSSPQGILAVLINKPGGKIPIGSYITRLFDANSAAVPGCEKPFDVQDEKTVAKLKIDRVKMCADRKECAAGGGTSCSTDLNNPAIATAIGCLHTSPAEFTKDILKFIIGIGGGFAFLMMLLGAYQMLTSAGNPEALKAGQDRLTSAIIGLLFIILSILLLQFIGAGILNLPGFTPP